MSKPFRINIFGKEGCQKCKTLNNRVERLLKKAEWADFEKVYYDLTTEEGLMHFCKTDCINPNRIPAMTIDIQSTESYYEAMENPRPGELDEICGKSKLYSLLGLQTDYASSDGVLNRQMISSVLSEALQHQN